MTGEGHFTERLLCAEETKAPEQYIELKPLDFELHALRSQLHNSGPRKHSRFVAADCSSLPPTLIESELFGHIRGAFTGADTNKKGLIEAANGRNSFPRRNWGIADRAQAKLLRAIQEHEIRPLGSLQAKSANASSLRLRIVIGKTTIYRKLRRSQWVDATLSPKSTCRSLKS